MSTDKSKRLIEKMKKLLAMSGSKANENEAMIATRQLHAMLAKHNMSLSEIEESDNDIAEDRELQRNRPWKRPVALLVARLYFCELYMSAHDNRKSHFVFVGTEANRTFAIHIFKMIVSTIERESRSESRKLYGKQNSGFVRSFWAGAKDRIIERCEDLITEAKSGKLQDEEGNTLPALLSTYERNELQVKDWMSTNLSLTKGRASRTRITNSAGAAKGREAGGRVQLSRALQGKAVPKLLN